MNLKSIWLSFKPLHVSLFLLLCLSNEVLADCRYYQESTVKIEQETAQLEVFSAYLDRLLLGQMNRDTNYSSVIKTPLDNPERVQTTIQQFQNQITKLSEPLPITDELAACAELGEAWLSASNQKRMAEVVLLKKKIAFFNKTKGLGLVLVRQVSMWEQALLVEKAINDVRLSLAEQDDVIIDLQLLNDWVLNYQQALESWLPLFLAKEQNFTLVDAVWLNVLALPMATKGVNQESLETYLPQARDWLDSLREVRAALIEDASKWRNRVMLEQGWLAFAKRLQAPEQFFQGLIKELVAAPSNFIENLSRPFLKAYRAAEKQDQQTQVLLSWFSQILGLVALSFALIKIAEGAASWFASLHQSLIAKLENASLSNVIAGTFWLIKPNASWMMILAASNFMLLFIQDDWRILALIAPIGSAYALFRAMRIMVEWVLSRTFTRSELFISTQVAEQILQDSKRYSWVALGCILAWWLAYQTGGGYLIYLVSIVGLFIFWLASMQLLAKNKLAVDRLIELSLNIKLKKYQTAERGASVIQAAKQKNTKDDLASLGFEQNKSEALRVSAPQLNETEPNVVLGWLVKLFWPWVFLYVHIKEGIFGVHQKMMIFDFYRSFNVKLMRVRLEQADDENDNQDEPEPDENYADWMLREATDDMLLEVGKLDSVIEPLNKWFNNKTDENITVVVGESGSGKTTFIRRLAASWEDAPVRMMTIPPKLTDPNAFLQLLSETLGIPSVDSVGALVEADASIKKQVIVIDQAHNLFMAEVGYFNAYRCLMECMNAHLENVYWVVVFNSPSWSYLSNIFSREQRISSIYKMPRWTPLDIRKLILSRHKGGKRKLTFNNRLLSAAASSESSSVRAADSRVFNILWEQAGGNPLAAIELWLNAIRVKGRIAEMGVPERPSANLLNGMKDDVYFVYTAIVLHNSLSTKEIMLVTHFSEAIVRHAVKQGINMGLITRDSTERYKIDPYWYGSLSGFLHRKNMLWN